MTDRRPRRGRTGRHRARTLRRPAVVLLIGTLATACRTPGDPALPTAAQRAAYGDVAVTVAPPGPAEIPKPVSGWAAGLGLGAVRGLGAVVVFAGYGAAEAAEDVGHDSGSFGALVVFTGAAIGAAVGAVYTPVSMIGGATTAPPGEDVAKAEVVIRPLAADPGLAGRFSAMFTARAQELTGRTPVEPGEATTLVELRIVSITAGRTWDWYTLDRPFEIRVAASARVVRAADGHLVWESTRTTGDPPENARAHTYVEWAANGGEELSRELDGALGTLATGFADSIFGGPPPAERAGVAE